MVGQVPTLFPVETAEAPKGLQVKMGLLRSTKSTQLRVSSNKDAIKLLWSWHVVSVDEQSYTRETTLSRLGFVVEA